MTRAEYYRDEYYRKQEERHRPQQKPFTYLTCCVNSTGPLINAMTERAQEITYRTMRQHCDLAPWAASMGYDPNTRLGGLSLANDWHVSYHKSTYNGAPCYYLRHSAIEYIFTEGGTHAE